MKKTLNDFHANNSEIKISLSGLAQHKEIYFVGDNGCGKSSLLRLLHDECEDSFFIGSGYDYTQATLKNKKADDISLKVLSFIKNVSSSKKCFENLSEGCKDLVGTAMFVNDAVCYGNAKTVLIDDFASNLSPNNVYKLIEFLRKNFPDTQFVFATNNPIAIMCASRDAVIYRLHRNVANKIIAEDPFYASEMSHLMANGVVTCPLFNMESARMRAYDESQDEDLDTSTSYLHGRIRKLLADEVKEMRKERGTPFISTEKLDDIIKNAIKKYKAE